MALKLRAGKRGVLFTMAAIIISIVIILSFKTHHGDDERKKNDVVLIRVQSVNDFLKDVEADLQKGVSITSIRTLLGIQEYLTEEGEYLPNATTAFKEGFLNGTIEQIPVNLLVNSTFPDWVGKIQQEAAKLDIEANLTITHVEISQQTPWGLNVTVVMEINVSDERKSAAWTKKKSVSSIISIVGLEDPLYSIETQGKVTTPIYPTNTTEFVDGYDMTAFMLHVNRSEYIASNLSPSYLMRLEGRINSSPMGIESLVNIPKLAANGVPLLDRSIADGVYFGSEATTNKRINNTPEWVKMDTQRLARYNLTNQTI